MKKILLVLFLAVLAMAFAFCSTPDGGNNGGGEISITDTATEWDQYLPVEDPAIFNSVWVDEENNMAIAILGLSYDTAEEQEAVKVHMTGASEPGWAWAYNKKDISLRQDVDKDGKKDKFKCITGEPIEMVKGQHQTTTTKEEALAGGPWFEWDIWFEKTNKDGLTFDICMPFDFIENCSPGCSKFKDVWVQCAVVE